MIIQKRENSNLVPTPALPGSGVQQSLTDGYDLSP
ncbi:hypothetical protein SAMN04489724_1051 [Algoriphagus locisalis]|uniref:Uncharacterized protein n=1 Tax=Algoriphagus locisalis TaxID=305507 RepID=A0A1I6YJL1_9BACT|nr:hypothetical protein SAMN04489724_1051 [Algoriphagus locisalis]